MRSNDLAAATIGEFVNIVPSGAIRQYPLPVLYEDDDKSHFLDRMDDFFNILLVPSMRPLLPRQGHMAVNAMSNTILIVDRYANVQRVTEMILRLDALTPSQPAE